MAGKVLDLENIISEDRLGRQIADYWITWDQNREVQKQRWSEIRNYLYATDTSTTSNSSLPWKNKTTIPKLTQIRDNLFANYMATMFPKRKWLKWEGDTDNDQAPEKKSVIESYIYYCIQHPRFKEVMTQLVMDYIDYGNVFGTVEWVDETSEVKGRLKKGYVGPMPRRISPLDIVFNPISPSFTESPKIIRSYVTLGELKKMIQWPTANTEEGQVSNELFDYFKGLRNIASDNGVAGMNVRDEAYSMDGFTSFRDYLCSPYIEVLTFYGDVYDYDTDEFLQNHKIVVVDRHKVIIKEPEPSQFGHPPIYHCGWRTRQDNLWAMSPLENLVGMQYRVDHLENLKADCFDLIAFPPLKIKGHVNDFTWGPFERIHVGDDGDVEVLSPNVEVLKANLEIENLMNKMEEMAGAPKEAMGFRTPGEKTKYEVQRLENAASRVFQNKIAHLEEQLLERLLNAMLELSVRYGVDISVRTEDEEFGAIVFTPITTDDIIGQGSIRPIAARHFAEQATLVQNLTQFYSSAIGQDPEVLVHFSGLKTARMMEDILEIADYELVEENVRVGERATTQRMMNAATEDVMVEQQTPAGITPDDFEMGPQDMQKMMAGGMGG